MKHVKWYAILLVGSALALSVIFAVAIQIADVGASNAIVQTSM
jgi:hypothetical protein